MTGKDLKGARLEKHWTQKDAAERLGVSQGYVSLLERQRRAVPTKLVSKLLKAYKLSPTALPLHSPDALTRTSNLDGLTSSLGALGYTGFSYLRNRQTRNPAEVLLGALMQRDLDSRVTEGLPWLAFKYSNDMNWDWLVNNAKLHDLQNRLGFVVTLARRFAERTDAAEKVSLLAQYEARLERSRLVREDTFCHDSLTNAEKEWLREKRPTEAQRWNLLTDLAPEQLTYAD
jgi:transcriptional regulator with XRE-family HTH domain